MSADFRFYDTTKLRLRASQGNGASGAYIEARATDDADQKIEVTFFADTIGSDILSRAADAFNAVMNEHDARVARVLADEKREAVIAAAGAAFAAE